MQYKTGICANCAKEKIIVNNTKKLCLYCNNKRLKDNKKDKVDKTNKLYNKINKTYNEIDIEREQMCSGCGQQNHLSRSHIISRKHRKDLEADKNNIKLHCLQRADGSKGCHQRWEGTLEEKMTLMDFEENMKYIKEIDIQHYNKIINLRQ